VTWGKPWVKIPFTYQRSAEDVESRIRGYQKPWNRVAEAVLDEHEQELTSAERELVESLRKRTSQPAQKRLDQLNAIAARFGIEVAGEG
jgi:hypothetical protein